MSPPSRKRRLAKLVLVVGSLGFAAVVGEAVLRVVGGFRLFGLRLEPVRTAARDPAAVLDLAPDLVAAFVERFGRPRPDVDPVWLRTSPAPLPPQPPLGKPALPQQDWLLHYYVTNGALLRAMWVKGQGLPMLPGLALPDEFTVFDPPGGKLAPRYRYPASCTLPTGLVLNRFGFRGRDLPVDKPPRTVRIGFVGASTTVEAHALPHSAPELVEHWLSLWAAAKGLDVRFETINAAREAIQSPDLRAIVDDELLPLEIDYLVYYEGANQFQPATLAKHVRVDAAYEIAKPPPGLVGTFDDTTNADSTWLDGLAAHSAAARYLRSALQRGERLAEPPKPPQQLTLPPELSAADFPLERAGEVLELSAIGADLDGIRAALEHTRAKLVLATFWWLAQEGMTCDPVWGRNVHVQLNRAYWPFRYSIVRDLAALQNRYFAAWAKARGVDLVDIAGALPQDERLAIDAIHHNELGVRLKAWLFFVQLVPLIERDVASGSLPVADRQVARVHPNLGATRVVSRAELDR